MGDYSISFQRTQIKEMLQDFHLLTRIPVAFVMHDQRYTIYVSDRSTPFCALLRGDPVADQACQDCDRLAFDRAKASGELHMYQCHAGLTEAIAPIFSGERLLGFLMMGKTTSIEPSDLTWKQIKERCSKYHIDMAALESIFLTLDPIPVKNMQAAARLLTRLAFTILTSGWVKPHMMPILEQIDNYVLSHLSEPIRTAQLSKILGISASHLEHVVKAETGSSLTEHLQRLRLAKAMEWLTTTDITISEIATRSGFEDPRYFSRVFRKFTGMTPMQYRQSEHHEDPRYFFKEFHRSTPNQQ